MPDPARAQVGVVRQHDLYRGAALSSCRGHDLDDQLIGAFLDAVAWGYDQHVNRAYEPAGSDRWSEADYRTAGYLTPPLGDHDASIRHVDELTQQAYRVQWSASAGRSPHLYAKRIQPIDIGDAGLPDQVLHSNARTSWRNGDRTTAAATASQLARWPRAFVLTLGRRAFLGLDSHARTGLAAALMRPARLLLLYAIAPRSCGTPRFVALGIDG